MRKNDLIAMLQAIPGNPEIKLWNGYVNDWMNIHPKIHKVDLVKLSKPSFLNMVAAHRGNVIDELPADDVKKLTEVWSTNHKYHINEHVTPEDIKSGLYVKKSIHILQADVRGISTYDRQGGMEY